MKIRTPLHAAHPGTRMSEGCPWPLRAEGTPQGHREENNHLYLYLFFYLYLYLYLYLSIYNIFSLTCNAVRFILCWFTGVLIGFNGILWISHVLACFSIIWCCQCNFCCWLLIFIFRQFLTYVWFFLLLPNLSLRSFFNDQIAHICGAVAFIPGGLLSSCAAMHAAFPRLLHASCF